MWILTKVIVGRKLLKHVFQIVAVHRQQDKVSSEDSQCDEYEYHTLYFDMQRILITLYNRKTAQR